jgi:hypothetical protein
MLYLMPNPWEIQSQQSTRLTILIHGNWFVQVMFNLATTDTRSLIAPANYTIQDLPILPWSNPLLVLNSNSHKSIKF